MNTRFTYNARLTHGPGRPLFSNPPIRNPPFPFSWLAATSATVASCHSGWQHTCCQKSVTFQKKSLLTTFCKHSGNTSHHKPVMSVLKMVLFKCLLQNEKQI